MTDIASQSECCNKCTFAASNCNKPDIVTRISLEQQDLLSRLIKQKDYSRCIDYLTYVIATHNDFNVILYLKRSLCYNCMCKYDLSYKDARVCYGMMISDGDDASDSDTSTDYSDTSSNYITLISDIYLRVAEALTNLCRYPEAKVTIAKAVKYTEILSMEVGCNRALLLNISTKLQDLSQLIRLKDKSYRLEIAPEDAWLLSSLPLSNKRASKAAYQPQLKLPSTCIDNQSKSKSESSMSSMSSVPSISSAGNSKTNFPVYDKMLKSKYILLRDGIKMKEQIESLSLLSKVTDTTTSEYINRAGQAAARMDALNKDKKREKSHQLHLQQQCNNIVEVVQQHTKKGVTFADIL